MPKQTKTTKTTQQPNTPPKEIRSIDDIQQLLLSGFTHWEQYGHVFTKAYDDLTLFCYTTAAQYEGRWNFFERVSRGLILNHVRPEIVARSFDKFFNYGQELPYPETFIVEATEKVDGSLGILLRLDEGYRIATKGSFDSEQAIWATEHLRQHHDLTGLDNDLTLLFEIVYPANRVVVDYGDLEALILIGARNRHYGHELYAGELDVLANQYGFLRPKVFSFDNIRDILNAAAELDVNSEGWVLRYSDNRRYKVKGDAYLLAHRMMTQISFKDVVRAVESNTLEQDIAGVPDEFLDIVKEYQTVIENKVADTLNRINTAYAERPEQGFTENYVSYRKRFAAWANKNYRNIDHYLFNRLDEKSNMPHIYRAICEEGYAGEALIRYADEHKDA